MSQELYTHRVSEYVRTSYPIRHAPTHETDGYDPISLEVGDLSNVDLTGVENGSELVYDTSGIQPVWRVKNRVHVRANITSPSAFTSGASTLVIWDTIDYQSEPVFDAEIFTAPYDDYYTVSLSLTFDPKIWAMTETIFVYVTVNGNETSTVSFVPQEVDSYAGWVSLTDHLRLEEGDEVSVYVLGTWAGTLIPNSNPPSNFISFHN